MNYSTSRSIIRLCATLRRVRLARVFRLSLSILFISTFFAHIGACQVIDDLTAQGKSVLKDLNLTSQEVALVEEKADKGNANTQYVLGWMYFIGQSVGKDNEKAVQWMTKAANQNVPHAQTQLGLMYLFTKDIEGHYTLAREWLLKGAARNETDALNALGGIYSQGLGVDVNTDKAIKYFRTAADAGFDKAQYNLGYLSYTGKLVPQDYKEAARWFQLAAQQDHVRATYSLGVMYRDGQGVPKILRKRFGYFKRARRNIGFLPPNTILGRCTSKEKVPLKTWNWHTCGSACRRTQDLSQVRSCSQRSVKK